MWPKKLTFCLRNKIAPQILNRTTQILYSIRSYILSILDVFGEVSEKEISSPVCSFVKGLRLVLIKIGFRTGDKDTVWCLKLLVMSCDSP